MELWLILIIAVGGLLVAVAFVRGSIESLSTVVQVPPFMQAIVFLGGTPPKLLDTGRHRFWTKDVQYQLVDGRTEWVQVGGQELLTKDGAPVRVSVAVLRSVTDIMKFAASGDAYSRIYVAAQLAVREQVLVRSLEELIDQRSEVDALLRETVEREVAPLGVHVEQLAIRDITMIGDTKRAYAEVIQAQLRAKAKLEQARGEAAAMRSLLNTAELVRKNPELLQLRTLQQLESGSHQVHLTLGEPTTPKEAE